eukprot:15451883-Alexandrium_andersonii.AAC.1
MPIPPSAREVELRPQRLASELSKRLRRATWPNCKPSAEPWLKGLRAFKRQQRRRPRQVETCQFRCPAAGWAARSEAPPALGPAAG